MHLQTPRILAVRDMLHMWLSINSFGAYAPQIPRISVNAKPIGKASNAKALINRSLCSHNLTDKRTLVDPV